uniref:Uncharacterized protein n=1 Tax=Oryza meridionalis TaxID=40149 RepID=A0A0E0E812_9ORYZ
MAPPLRTELTTSLSREVYKAKLPCADPTAWPLQFAGLGPVGDAAFADGEGSASTSTTLLSGRGGKLVSAAASPATYGSASKSPSAALTRAPPRLSTTFSVESAATSSASPRSVSNIAAQVLVEWNREIFLHSALLALFGALVAFLCTTVQGWHSVPRGVFVIMVGLAVGLGSAGAMAIVNTSSGDQVTQSFHMKISAVASRSALIIAFVALEAAILYCFGVAGFILWVIGCAVTTYCMIRFWMTGDPGSFSDIKMIFTEDWLALSRRTTDLMRKSPFYLYVPVALDGF